MEDSHVVLPAGTWKAPDPNMTYLAVHDGHGGRDIVNFLEETLAKNVAQELAFEDDATMETRLERAFLLTDIQSKQFGLETSGATVAICLVSQNVIYSANAGDARVVIGHHGRAHRLSWDHRADDEREVQRIQEAGGFVLKNRVTGILAVGRSLGDHGLKEFVISKPYFSSFQDAADFVIVACDGLFDVMTDQQVVDLVYKWENDKENVANVLCKQAVASGSTDNVTCIVSWLR
jgi:serine/threonine protein phosphatase PrpC